MIDVGFSLDFWKYFVCLKHQMIDFITVNIHVFTFLFIYLVLPPSALPSLATGSASCDFDQDYCSYTQDSVDDFDWSRLQGATSSVNTGPTSDHTSGAGKMTYIHVWPLTV